MICAVITEKSAEEFLRAIARALERADLVELRLDYLDLPINLAPLLAAARGKAVVTCRPRSQGGFFKGAEKDRLDLLLRADEAGAAYVDVEFACLGRLSRRLARAKLILSHHDFEKMPLDLPEIARSMESAGADVVKVVGFARDAADNAVIFDILKNARRPTVALAMGEFGLASRILAPRFGAAWTYASVQKGAESAPGQITIEELRGLYHDDRIGPATRLYGVIANPVAHSASPAIMNAAFVETGFDGVYVPLRVRDVASTVRAFRAVPFDGYSVTIPHKTAVMDCLDEVEPLAARVGAVNTVVRGRDGKLAGFNTDLVGAMTALEKALLDGNLRGRAVLVIGAGGAARAIVFGLMDRGARVTIANRTVSRAESLAKEAGAQFCGLDDLESRGAEILVNCTSVGMHPHIDETPVPVSCLRKGMIVFDTVYNPIETRLLAEAARRGAKTVSGLEMFIGQAARQFELWTGLQAPREVMENALRRKLGA